MFKRLGEWFDSLWENGKETVAVAKEIKTTFKEQEHLYDRIKELCNEDSDRIAILGVSKNTKIELMTQQNSEKIYAFRWMEGNIYWCDCNESPFSQNNRKFNVLTRAWIDTIIDRKEPELDEFSYQLPVSSVDWWSEIKSYSKDIKPFFYDKAVESINKSKPHTSNHTFGGVYAISTNVEMVYCAFKNYAGTYYDRDTILPWVVDVIVHVTGDKYKKDPVDKFIINNEHEVAYKLLPHSHWRRWIKVVELEDSKGTWTIRHVPKNSATGKIRYFRLDINFDAVGLEGTAFDITGLIYNAIKHTHTNADRDLVVLAPVCIPPGRDAKPVSNIYLNMNNITVKHKEVELSLKGYIACQVKPVFHDNHPFFNPQDSELDYDGNYFEFTHDFKTRDFHKCTIFGDQWPDAK